MVVGFWKATITLPVPLNFRFTLFELGKDLNLENFNLHLLPIYSREAAGIQRGVT